MKNGYAMVRRLKLTPFELRVHHDVCCYTRPLGIICVMLGIFNMCGNIGTIHWYNRRKVTKENQKAYCVFVGLGTLIVTFGARITI